MAIEVKETVFGKLVPDHLLNFSGDSGLQIYFRDLLKTNYGKGFDKIDLGQCSTCHASLTVNDSPRLKPLPKMTYKIHRLLKKQADGKQLGKYGQHVLKRYLQSKQQMIVKCTKCQSINTMSLMSREDLVLFRSQCLKNATSFEPDEKESKSTRKKKRKKKQKTAEVFSPNSLLPLHSDQMSSSTPSQSTLKKSATEASICASLPSGKKSASLQELVKPATRVEQSANSLLQKSLRTSASRKSENSAKPTPLHHETKKSLSKQKQLKAFLKESLSDKKSVSLSDFLSSL